MSESFIYKAFGLIISSEIEIPEFLKGSGNPDVHIIIGNIPETIPDVYKEGFRFVLSKNEFILRFKDWAEFYVKDGKQIVIKPEKDVDERDVRAFLLSPVIAILLHQRGLLPLHSSGIIYKNKAVLFAGNSGAGKSTLAMALNRKYQYPLISDDIIAIQKDNNKPVAFSSFPSVKLWDDSSEMLDIPIEEMPFIRKDIFKRRYDNTSEFYNGVLEPSIIFFIGTSDNNEVNTREIIGTEKFNFLRQHIFRGTMVGEIYAQNQFGILAAILSKVKCYELKRPKSTFTPESLVVVVHDIIEKSIK